MTEIVNRFVSQKEAYAAEVRAFKRGRDINIEDPQIDLVWAKIQEDTSGPRPYFDYFYSGEDIAVYLGETGDDPEFGDLPIHNLAFNVEQQKMPIYGYASYTYDGVLRGTRLVTGQMTLITKYPGYMKRLLAKAASNRANNARNLADDYPSPEGWTDDDENLERYWGKTVDKSALAQEGSEWSIHPPFSLVIVYGVDSISVDANTVNTRYNRYQDDNLLFYDTNQRLVESSNTKDPSRIVLDGCELMSVHRTYQTSLICVEQYNFFARDIFVPAESEPTGSRVTSDGRIRGGAPNVVF